MPLYTKGFEKPLHFLWCNIGGNLEISGISFTYIVPTFRNLS